MRSHEAVAQLKQYHERVVRFRQSLPGDNLLTKARHALAAMRAIEPTIGDREIFNIRRWLSVEPSDSPQPPHTCRDQQRFSIFMKAAGIDKLVADAYWNLAIVRVRIYSIEEGQDFNRHVVQFIMDPEGVVSGNHLARL